MKRITYTKKLHAHRASLMMQKIESGANISGCCPAAPGFHFSRWHMWKWKNDQHQVCAEFVGSSKYTSSRFRCPCFALGLKEALTRTKLALKEYYK